jgi:GNAT superfamily N-acetyltransferase
MTLEFSVDPELTEGLRDEILDCWTDVSQAGGAVGFVPPVTRAEIAPTAEQAFAGAAAGTDRLVVGRVRGGAGAGDGDPAAGRLAALAFIVDGQHGLTPHWRTVKRVMVHPDFQGRGYGLELMTAVAGVGRSMGLDMLHLDCRSGTGVDEFYKRTGYLEWGRFPGALRLSADEFRDQISLYLPL